MTKNAPAPGDVIEDYQILEKIGGNMGLVFKARHRLLEKVVALKLVPADWIADPERIARFHREMRVMGQLEHPNLVTAADARSLDSWHLVAMEWIEGMDLQRLVRAQGSLPINVACEAARQAALGLDYAHQHGLIHRDIKPSNLMLTRTGAIKVIDLGLALVNEDATTQLTQAGAVLGTLAYCAPEQACNASKVDTRADIYSLGCTLYHLLAGKAPYAERKTITEILQAHLNEPFPSLAAARPDVPTGLEKVLERMTAKDPDSRYATASEVAEMLEPFARGADLKQILPPTTPGNPPTNVTPGKPPLVPEGRRPVPPGEPQRKPALSRRAALLVLLLAIIGVALSFRKFRRPDPVVPVPQFPVPVAELKIVMMDTTARGGIYDPNNYNTGGSNAKEVAKVLQEDLRLPARFLFKVNVSSDWADEDFVRSQRPHLLIIHRSVFFHPLNATHKYGASPQFAKPSEDPNWVDLYNAADEKLISLLGFLGTAMPHIQFLVYSRGTDPNWLEPGFQEAWTRHIESQYHELEGRVFTMIITGEKKGSFRNPETRELLVQRVKDILKLINGYSYAPILNVTNRNVQRR